MKKFTYPLTLPIVTVITVLMHNIILDFLGLDGEWGLLPFAIVAIGAYLLVILPRVCWKYGRNVVNREKNRQLFGLYNSAMITLPYFLPLCMEDETYLYSAILFVWCEIWFVVGAAGRKHISEKE